MRTVRQKGNEAVKKLLCLLLAAAACMGCLLLAGCSAGGGETVMEYRGYKITAPMYQYFSATLKANILKASGVKDSDEFWDTEVTDGVTAETYYTEMLDRRVKNLCISEYLFRYYGLKLEDSVKKSIEDDINEKIEYYGGRAALNEALATLGINISILKEIYTIEEKQSAVYSYLFGDGGSMEPDDSEVEEYYRSNYSRMYYIVLYTTKPVKDSEGNYIYDTDGSWKTEQMTEEEIAAVKEKAQTLFHEAEEGDDALFVSLMKENSDFDILTNYPNGLFVSANEYETYGAKIVNLLGEMKPGDVRTFEESYSVWILRKLELTEYSELSDTDIKQLSSLAAYTAQKKYTQYFDEIGKEVSVSDSVKQEYGLRRVEASRMASSV